MKQVLIDGDPFAYRASFSCADEELEAAIEKVDDLLDQSLNAVLWEPEEEDYQVFLTGKGNFRYDIAVTYEYKGNRKNTEKPEHLQGVRQHMIDNWDAIVSEGEEADDLIGIWATSRGNDAIVVSIDKDMLQIPCNHYNPNKNSFKTVTELEGLRFFYSQILTGDSADNIVGLYGVGPVKAKTMLEDCETEEDMYEVCLRAYSGDEDRVVENARLLWLRRHKDQLWEQPKCTSTDRD